MGVHCVRATGYRPLTRADVCGQEMAQERSISVATTIAVQCWCQCQNYSVSHNQWLKNVGQQCHKQLSLKDFSFVVLFCQVGVALCIQVVSIEVCECLFLPSGLLLSLLGSLWDQCHIHKLPSSKLYHRAASEQPTQVSAY